MIHLLEHFLRLFQVLAIALSLFIHPAKSIKTDTCRGSWCRVYPFLNILLHVLDTFLILTPNGYLPQLLGFR